MSGNLFIVSAPSGAGKSSLVAGLLKADDKIKLSVSYTTRAPRAGELHGREYYFISKEKFEAMIAAGEFLESALVHGNYYGTSKAWIAGQRAAGSDILLEIDWQGAQQVRRVFPDVIGVFILPPSFETLVSRLNTRAQDAPDVIARRLSVARDEISHVVEFDYVIINDKFDEAVQDLVAVVRAQRLRLDAQTARHGELINRMK
jgi:guanylate kinase